jgi:hypothetical protein
MLLRPLVLLLWLVGLEVIGGWRGSVGMTITREAPAPRLEEAVAKRSVAPRPRDLQQTFRLILATVWLMDAALQLQPFMFAKGSSGFSGMLNGVAPGNPGWVSHTITWNASIVDHQPVLTNTVFAGIQFLIAFGIAWRRTVRSALVLSIVWSIGVWWFGEGLGGVLTGAATPLGGGPGAVLFYALLAVLLWPSEGPNEPFVAARTVGITVARGIWAAAWAGLAVLAVVGHARSAQALHDLVAKVDSRQPGWVGRVDRWSESNLLHHGTAVAIVFAVFCLFVALSVYLRPTVTQIVLSAAIVSFVLIWVSIENFGGILAGGATDPNSGLLVVLLIALYWPLKTSRASEVIVVNGRRRARTMAET